jgi:hypothetical protein
LYPPLVPSSVKEEMMAKETGKKNPAAAGASAFKPTQYMTCVESSFLSTAFGPEYLNKDVSQDHFLDAFRLPFRPRPPVQDE